MRLIEEKLRRMTFLCENFSIYIAFYRANNRLHSPRLTPINTEKIYATISTSLLEHDSIISAIKRKENKKRNVAKRRKAFPRLRFSMRKYAAQIIDGISNSDLKCVFHSLRQRNQLYHDIF